MFYGPEVNSHLILLIRRGCCFSPPFYSCKNWGTEGLTNRLWIGKSGFECIQKWLWSPLLNPLFDTALQFYIMPVNQSYKSYGSVMVPKFHELLHIVILRQDLVEREMGCLIFFNILLQIGLVLECLSPNILKILKIVNPVI